MNDRDMTAKTSMTVPLALGAVLLAGALSSCSRTEGPGPKKNVILICLDTVRADHLGAYGYEENPTSPTLDELARCSTLFLDTSAAAGWTKPSVPSYMTGTYPLQHGVYEGHSKDRDGEHSDVLPDQAITLAEVFQARGYQTAAFVQNAQLRKGQGIEQGFDLYTDRAGDARNIRWSAVDWIDDRVSRQPFFLYLHFLDAHWPYPVPDEYGELFSSKEAISLFRTKDWKQLRDSINDGETTLDTEQKEALLDLYDGALRYIDDQLARLLSGLSQRGLKGETIICVLSDHGEEFLEHGKIGHGHGLHEELLQVPWILHVPGEEPRVVDTPVSLVDLFPTLLHAADIASPVETEGIDRIHAPDRRRESIAEHKAGRSYQQSIREGDLKVIRSFKRQKTDFQDAPSTALDWASKEPVRLSVELRPGSGGTLVASEIKPRGDMSDPMEMKGVIESISGDRLVLNGIHVALAPDVELYGDTTGPSGTERQLEVELPVKVKVRAVGDSLETFKVKLYAPDPAFESEVRGVLTAFDRTATGGVLHLGPVAIEIDELTAIELKDERCRAITREDLLVLLANPACGGSDYRRQERLHDLSQDPAELFPIQDHPELERLSLTLDRLGSRLSREVLWSSSDRSTLTAEEISDLEAIGYAASEE